MTDNELAESQKEHGPCLFRPALADAQDRIAELEAAVERAREAFVGIVNAITPIDTDAEAAALTIATDALASLPAPQRAREPKPCAHHARLFPCGKEGCAECVVVPTEKP